MCSVRRSVRALPAASASASVRRAPPAFTPARPAAGPCECRRQRPRRGASVRPARASRAVSSTVSVAASRMRTRRRPDSVRSACAERSVAPTDVSPSSSGVGRGAARDADGEVGRVAAGAVRGRVQEQRAAVGAVDAVGAVRRVGRAARAVRRLREHRGVHRVGEEQLRRELEPGAADLEVDVDRAAAVPAGPDRRERHLAVGVRDAGSRAARSGRSCRSGRRRSSCPPRWRARRRPARPRRARSRPSRRTRTWSASAACRPGPHGCLSGRAARRRSTGPPSSPAS